MKRTIILVSLALLALLFSTVFTAAASPTSQNGTLPEPPGEELTTLLEAMERNVEERAEILEHILGVLPPETPEGVRRHIQVSLRQDAQLFERMRRAITGEMSRPGGEEVADDGDDHDRPAGEGIKIRRHGLDGGNITINVSGNNNQIIISGHGPGHLQEVSRGQLPRRDNGSSGS